MRFDTVIVGSGPAGSSAALFLSDSDMSIAVIERLDDDRYRRYHSICAAGISKGIVDRYLPLEDQYIRNRFGSVDLVLPDMRRVKVKATGYILDRPAFFRHVMELAETKGVKRIVGSVTGIVETDDGYEISLLSGNVISCRYLIGADGAFSVVRRRLFGSKPKMNIPVVEYIKKGTSPDRLEISIDERFNGGYSWVFPSGDNICTGSVKGSISENEYLFKGARYIPFGGVGDIVKGNALLIGDAAAMANPVSFGGLTAAILSAKKATDSILKGDTGRYQKWWDGSKLSDSRFMEFHEVASGMSNEEMISMSACFKHDRTYFDGMCACLRNPSKIKLLFACYYAFKRGW